MTIASSSNGVSPALKRLLADGRLRFAGAQTPDFAYDKPKFACPTGITEIDQALPAKGLEIGATHEWLASDSPSTSTSREPWTPPLTILSLIASQMPTGMLVWIGRRLRPLPATLAQAQGLSILSRCLFIDPPDDSSKLWAIDQALRNPAIGAVIADGSRLDMGASRRLQLAAAAGQTLGLLARPPWEAGHISAAATRWSVRPVPTHTKNPRWKIEILHCKTGAVTGQWTIERTREPSRGTCSLRIPADVVGGSSAATVADIQRRIA